MQPDRFTFNWRKIDDGTEYLRYERLKELFRAELEVFQLFLSDNDLGSAMPTQCELTYVNHLPQGIGGTRQADLHLVLSSWAPPESGGLLPEIEGVRLAWHYRFVDGDSLLGRLHVQAQSARKKDDDTPIIVLPLIARGSPNGDGMDGVFSFADRAHAWIVRGSAEITTRHMHTWAREPCSRPFTTSMRPRWRPSWPTPKRSGYPSVRSRPPADRGVGCSRPPSFPSPC